MSVNHSEHRSDSSLPSEVFDLGHAPVATFPVDNSVVLLVESPCGCNRQARSVSASIIMGPGDGPSRRKSPCG